MQITRNNPISAIKIFHKLFSGVIFYKKEDFDGSSVYVVKMSRMTITNHNDYIILVCSLSNETKAFYHQLSVKSIQTRTLPSYYFGCPSIVWKPDRIGYEVYLKIDSRQKQYTKYITVENDIDVMLFNDPKKKDVSGKTSSYQYPDRLSLLGALETFKCVISLLTTPIKQNTESSDNEQPQNYVFL